MKFTIALFFLGIIAWISIGYVSNPKEIHTLKIGDKIPMFELSDQNGQLFKIQDVIGTKNLVIYFYPKDDTPGCTKEACKFRDDFELFTDLDAMVIGISSDSPQSHKKFEEKYNLPFTLLSDADNSIRKQFGVPGELLNFVPGRVTFIVDKKGVVRYVFNSLSESEKHVSEALKTLEKLQ